MADFKLLEMLCDAKGVSGNDDEVKKIIIECIKDYCDKLYIDKVGQTCQPTYDMCTHR